jgi:UDP-N-acetylglucosamine:LPS N-acetylglucosamine transferase
MRYFEALYKNNPHEFVLHSPISEPVEMQGRTTIITFSERDWRFLVNMYEAWKLLRKHKSRVVLTTGGGFSVAFALVAKLMRIPTIYIETWAKIDVPTATGRIMYRITPHFFYQWPQLAKHFPKATYIGLLA